MTESNLNKLLGKQFLIASYIETKLEIVNYIKEGYDSNAPVLMDNRFLHYSAHTYYRSLIIDLFALFGPANSNNKNSFKQIDLKFQSLLRSDRINDVREWLQKSEDDIKTIMLLRHKQVAHYDFAEKGSIRLNFDNLEQLNHLFEIAKKIIIHLGHAFLNEEIRISYDFGRKHQYLESLERLVAKVTSR